MANAADLRPGDMAWVRHLDVSLFGEEGDIPDIPLPAEVLLISIDKTRSDATRHDMPESGTVFFLIETGDGARHSVPSHCLYGHWANWLDRTHKQAPK